MTMKISVAMCTYNGARYLREQLESIAAQTKPPAELVVCDDRSADATREIVESFAAAAPFPVRVHVNERNLGSTKNFERAIGLCAGDIIALSDQDDVWLPGKLARLEAEFVRAPGVGLIFTDAELIDEDSRPSGRRLWEEIGFHETHRERLRAGMAVDELLPGSTVTGATMAFRSRFRELVLPIPDDLDVIHDGWIAMLVAAAADISYIADPLILYRRHPRQQVGPRERKNGGGAAGLGGVRDALRRTNSYESLIEIGSRAHRRLSEHQDAYGCDETLSKLEARLAHLRARASLPERRLARALCILKELLSLRYRRYSNGVYSAVKDLLA